MWTRALEYVARESAKRLNKRSTVAEILKPYIFILCFYLSISSYDNTLNWVLRAVSSIENHIWDDTWKGYFELSDFWLFNPAYAVL